MMKCIADCSHGIYCGQHIAQERPDTLRELGVEPEVIAALKAGPGGEEYDDACAELAGTDGILVTESGDWMLGTAEEIEEYYRED